MLTKDKQSTSIIDLDITTESAHHTLNMTFLIFGACYGALYFFVAVAGVNNIKRVFLIGDYTASILTYGFGLSSSVIATMFAYKTLEYLSLRPRGFFSWVLVSLAPFAATSFLAACVEGAYSMAFSGWLVYTFGFVLYFFRMLSMIDGAAKFEKSLEDISGTWRHILEQRNIVQFIRLFITLYISIGYTISTADAMHTAFNKIVAVFDIHSSSASTFSYFATYLGAIGSFPMNLYWTHTGIKQLTDGAKNSVEDQESNPSDKWTIIGAIAAFPVALGVLGAATGTGGGIFSRFGATADVVRITTSVAYSICSATPGLATLLRALSVKKICCETTVKLKSKHWG